MSSTGENVRVLRPRKNLRSASQPEPEIKKASRAKKVSTTTTTTTNTTTTTTTAKKTRGRPATKDVIYDEPLSTDVNMESEPDEKGKVKKLRGRAVKRAPPASQEEQGDTKVRPTRSKQLKIDEPKESSPTRTRGVKEAKKEEVKPRGRPAKRPQQPTITQKKAPARTPSKTKGTNDVVYDEPSPPPPLPPLPPQPPIVLSATESKILLEPSEPSGGRVMTFGEDNAGTLGLKNLDGHRKRPTFIDGISHPVIHIAANGMHTVCLTSKGTVYSWGCNDEGALGRDTSSNEEEQAEPKKVHFPSEVQIKKVTAGDSHSLALTESGTVFIWGNFKDSHGSIGLTPQSREKVSHPIEIELTFKVIDIASGENHVLLLNDAGCVYSFGVAEQGRLGRIEENLMEFQKDKPELYLNPHPVQFSQENLLFDKIWARNWSSFARAKTGEIYAWGVNNYSQLGFKTEIPSETDSPVKGIFVPSPQPVPAFSKIDGSIENICPGSHHTLFLDSKGKVYSCGRGHYGRLGHGKGDEVITEPELIKALESMTVIDIASGETSSFAVTSEGDLYSWGMGSLQLGTAKSIDEDVPDAYTPQKVTSSHLERNRVIAVSAGSSHTVIIVKDVTKDQG
ncbi:regulator of chromosome condensation-like [Brevipalpus obovatus]|uniref:regulator of chromosome condensation-like n=1 Tax=Brevipalpus obovatus TaxID=246614 RepID=UPI003D9E9E46